MGHDDIFHQRRARTKEHLKRKKDARKPYKKILIVCEGQKTEPQYFKGAREFYKLSSVNVEITGKGSDPMSLVRTAKEMFKREEQKGDAYDAVYCVFDKDQHASYHDAMNTLGGMKPHGIWHAINSVPSFEFWLLLHYKYTTKSYTANGKHSAGDLVIKDLMKFMPQYKKGMSGLFALLSSSVDNAKKNSASVLKACNRDNTDNPSTKVHLLVETMQNLKK